MIYNYKNGVKYQIIKSKKIIREIIPNDTTYTLNWDAEYIKKIMEVCNVL